jgi:hypothetical protein
MDDWLQQFPRHQQAIITAWFSAVRVPGQTPDDLLHRASEVIARRLDWAPARDTAELCQAVLLALLHQRPGARQFAQSLLERS